MQVQMRYLVHGMKRQAGGAELSLQLQDSLSLLLQLLSQLLHLHQQSALTLPQRPLSLGGTQGKVHTRRIRLLLL